MEEGGFEGNQWNGALELVQLKWNGQQQRRRVLKKEIKLFHYNSSLRGVVQRRRLVSLTSATMHCLETEMSLKV